MVFIGYFDTGFVGLMRKNQAYGLRIRGQFLRIKSPKQC
jgi:hypothetical protein